MKKYSVLLCCIVVMIACNDNKDEGDVTYLVNNHSDLKVCVGYQIGKRDYLIDIKPHYSDHISLKNSSTLDK